MMDWNDAWGADWPTVVVMCGLMLAGWVALATVIWIAARGAGTFPRTPPTDPSRILDARLARGELSEDEYLTARSLLEAHKTGSGTQGGHRGSA